MFKNGHERYFSLVWCVKRIYLVGKQNMVIYLMFERYLYTLRQEFFMTFSFLELPNLTFNILIVAIVWGYDNRG